MFQLFGIRKIILKILNIESSKDNSKDFNQLRIDCEFKYNYVQTLNIKYRLNTILFDLTLS